MIKISSAWWSNIYMHIYMYTHIFIYILLYLLNRLFLVNHIISSKRSVNRSQVDWLGIVKNKTLKYINGIIISLDLYIYIYPYNRLSMIKTKTFNICYKVNETFCLWEHWKENVKKKKYTLAQTLYFGKKGPRQSHNIL